MRRDAPTRRDVLTTIGAAGVTSLVGPAAAAPGESARIVEVYRTYDLPESRTYDKFHWDALPPYVVDEERGTVRPVGSDSLPTGDEAGVNGPDGAPGVARGREQVFGGDETSSLVTRTAPRGRTAETVSLARPFSPPRFGVTVESDGTAVDHPNGQARAIRGEETAFSVDVGTVSVQTVRTLDETVDDPDIPPGQRAMKTVRGTTEVPAELSVRVRDFGELTVAPPRR